MQVTINIPQSILDIILEAGYDEDQAPKLFKGYIDSIVHHPFSIDSYINITEHTMKKVVLLGITYYEVNLGGVSYMSFNPQELVVRMAQANLSLN